MKLLELLQGRPDAYFWPEGLGRAAGLPVARVMRDLDELEQFGFPVERHPHRGIRCGGPADRLCPDQIESQLGTRVIGRRIAVWERVTSTNDLAARAARSPANDGLVILAEEQTAGRGRRHRRWHAPPRSSILMSVLLFPPEPARDSALLTCLAAVAVADVAIDSLGLPARIKWPNDVRVAGRKVCGVLVEDLTRKKRSQRSEVRGQGSGVRGQESDVGSQESGIRSQTAAAASATASQSSGVGVPASAGNRHAPASARTPISELQRAVVIGIGVNVNIEPHEFPEELADTAGSLMACCGRRLDRSELARSLIRRLDHHYQRALEGDAVAVWQRWRELADLVGCSVRVERAQDEISGRLVDLWPERGMLIQTPSGELLQLPAEQILSVTERSI